VLSHLGVYPLAESWMLYRFAAPTGMIIESRYRRLWVNGVSKRLAS
jgi:hypothetical protein